MAKGNWQTLDHDEKLRLFQVTNEDDLIDQYLPTEMDRESFRALLQRDRDFWNADNIKKVETEDQPPTKLYAIGAWRDLTRVEALLELMDNSIDAWMRRKRQYAAKYVAENLQIYIRVENATRTLEYRDNAGGVPRDKLINLVIPGFSETAYDEPTIGSYRTGGKKALFRLGEEVNIRTNYWSPAGTETETYAIHLDTAWLQNDTLYKFPIATLNTNPDDKGVTVYRFRMRDESIGRADPWYLDSGITGDMVKNIRQTYTLLLLRHPEIEIYFLDYPEKLTPLENLYDFAGTNEAGTDLRPQRLTFRTEMVSRGVDRPVEIEIVLGCRRTTGGDDWGVDLYGNDRLFVPYEKESFVEWYRLGTQQVSRLLRGYVNIKGPNVFIPWDTHKRHFNPEMDVVTQILQKDPRIKEFFRNWSQAYKGVANLASGGMTKAIRKKLTPWKDSRRADLNIPISGSLDIPPHEKRAAKGLPKGTHKPKVASPISAKTKLAKIQFTVTESEFRILRGKYRVEGTFDDASAREELGARIKESALRVRR